MVINVNKVPNLGNKTEIEIEINGDIKIATTENPKGESYKVTDVIIHLGSQTTNGHYITTHYNEDQGMWEKIDDERCEQLSNKEAEHLNRHGVIYVRRRSELSKGETSKITQTYVRDDDYRKKEQPNEMIYQKRENQFTSREESTLNSSNQQQIGKCEDDEDGFILVERRNKARRMTNDWNKTSRQYSMEREKFTRQDYYEDYSHKSRYLAVPRNHNTESNYHRTAESDNRNINRKETKVVTEDVNIADEGKKAICRYYLEERYRYGFACRN